MKILIIQLARLGDIYMTWPFLRALRRSHPAAEIHLLTRPRFEGAVEGLDAIDRHLSIPVSHILAPLVREEADIDSSLLRLDETIQRLQHECYDVVVNLTFSPASSYLTHLIAQTNTQMYGYSRYDDGTLCLADEISAYFYAQVGTNKANRVHLADIFASMLDLQYNESDWRAPEILMNEILLPESYIVVHVGASEQHKAIPAQNWIQILSEVAHKYAHLNVVLVGAANEVEIAHNIATSIPELNFINLVGRTKIVDLFAVLQEADLLVGCDSAPMHMASLTDTPTLNISLGQVNFWETGPKASLSFIYKVEDGESVDTKKVGELLCFLLNGQVSPELIIRSAGVVSFERVETAQDRFQWDLLQAIYLGGSYPVAERMEIVQGAVQLKEVNTLAIEQISQIPQKGLAVAGPMLDQIDEVIKSISQIVPELSPLINWYLAEKVRIGPGSLEDICSATLNVHERFAAHLQAYIPHDSLFLTNEEEACDGTV